MEKKIFCMFTFILLITTAVPVVISLQSTDMDNTIPSITLTRLEQSWSETKTLVSSNDTESDFSSSSVSLEGNTVIGVINDDNNKESTRVFTTENLNQPPFFGSPYPLNNSINNPLSLIFSIPINDPEGDKFSWTIQCINGQTTGGTNAVNGTQYLVIDGLLYSTTYKVWVNATDPTGSGLYTRSMVCLYYKSKSTSCFWVTNSIQRFSQ